MHSQALTCVISGSFKFKPEIDLLYDELEESGIVVLAPDKGWLYSLPERSSLLYPDGFRPLPSEKGMAPREVEEAFLRHLGGASLVFLNNPEGYLGEMTSFELGQAVAQRKPVYAKEPLAPGEFALDNIELWIYLKNYVKVLPIAEIPDNFYVAHSS